MALQRMMLIIVLFFSSLAFAQDPLPSWNEGEVKASIINFVERVTSLRSPDFVAEADRIAVFDNDGTLLAEQPLYFQLQFIIEQVQARWDEHPEWKSNKNLQLIKDGNLESFFNQPHVGKVILEVLTQVHAGLSAEQFAERLNQWFETSKHPRFDRPYIALHYKPMRELLDYLKSKGFKNFIVSGSGIDFLRTFSLPLFGIPAEQVIGSNGKYQVVEQNGKLDIQLLPEANFVDDGPNKVIGIHYNIGRRPIMAFGNSDGDLEMLRWTKEGSKARFSALVHHTDAEREWKYDRDSKIGRLDKALDMAREKDWKVIDMKRDWKVIFQ